MGVLYDDKGISNFINLPLAKKNEIHLQKCATLVKNPSSFFVLASAKRRKMNSVEMTLQKSCMHFVQKCVSREGGLEQYAGVCMLK